MLQMISATRNPPSYLRVEVGQPTARVVALLERAVGRPVVVTPELGLGVVNGRVQGLVSTELGHEALDPPVVRVGPVRAHRDGGPEPDVDVELAGPQRVQRPLA